MDQIEEIKAKNDIVNLIGSYLPLKKTGRNFKTTCPFHKEKTPSFVVSPELQIFKCFGCGESGDIIKFLQLYEKMDFWEAVELLARRGGIKLVSRRLSKDDQIKKRIYQANHLAAEFYHFLLTKHDLGKKALNYVLGRGIKKKSVEDFQLGFSPAQPEAVVNFLIKKGFSKPEIMETGIAFVNQKENYWDRFQQRLVFPLLDHRANVVGFSGRAIPGISSSKMAKYINTPETKTYHKSQNLYGLWLAKEEISKKKEAIVVEGEFDVISAFQAGVKNAVAIKGTAFTEGQAKLIRRFAETAILALDQDIAGSEAIKKSSQVAELVGLDVKIALLPKGIQDLDQLIQKKPDLVKKTLASLVSVWDFVIDFSFSKHSLGDPIGKRKILAESLPFLIEIENEVVKNHFFQKLARKLKVSLESVLIEAEKTKDRKTGFGREKALDSAPSQTRRYLLEKQLLTAIFSQEKWSHFKNKTWFKLISFSLFKQIIDLAGEDLKKKKKFSVKDFFNNLPEELKAGFKELYLVWGEGLEEDIGKIILSLKEEDLRRQLSEIGLKVSRLEKEKKIKQLIKSEKDFVKISRQLTDLQREQI